MGIGNKVRVGFKVGREPLALVTLNLRLVKHLWRPRENPEVDGVGQVGRAK